MPHGPQEDAIAVFADLLLPGDGAWPSASAALGDMSELPAALTEADRIWLDREAAHIMAASDRLDAMKALERRDRAVFQRVLQALYNAYYMTEAALAQVHLLAAAGPREPSPFFDTSLLQQVIARQAGRRRL